MATATDVVAAAHNDISYTECPRDGRGRCLFTGHTGAGQNHTKFAAEASLPNGVYWCDVWVNAVYARCHVPLPPGVRSASTRTTMQAWQRAGQFVGPNDIEAGDQILYCVEGRNGPGVPDHTGLATGKPWRGHVPSIDGNTSSDNHGSQSNGGGVFVKDRPMSVVLGAGRPLWTSNQPAPNPPEDDDVSVPTIYIPCDDNLSAIDPKTNKPYGPQVLVQGNVNMYLSAQAEHDHWVKQAGAKVVYGTPFMMLCIQNNLSKNSPRG